MIIDMIYDKLLEIYEKEFVLRVADFDILLTGTWSSYQVEITVHDECLSITAYHMAYHMAWNEAMFIEYDICSPKFDLDTAVRRIVMLMCYWS